MIPQDLATGTQEKPFRVGRYDVVGLIGAGGMGAVYDAIDREHGTRVALKTLSHLSATNLLLFKSEFRSVADLSHPQLVPVYELACHDDLWFFTMQRIEGTDFISALRGAPAHGPRDPEQGVDLTERTTHDPAFTAATVRVHDGAHRSSPPPRSRASAPPSVDRLRDAFGQLVRGIRALHAANLLHLDIKPTNVLVDADDRVVVVDFGLVRAIEGKGAVRPDRRAIYGTPGWMAPEQDAGGAVGPATDWYAIGLLLYLALTGVSAFAPGDGPPLTLAERPLPPPPEQLVPGLPTDLCALAVALLHPDPAFRPTGDDIAAHLFGDEGERRTSARVVRRLVGRDAERARLAEALQCVRERGAAVVHVVGPSGVGKTALLDALLEDASAGALVLRGRCYERESVPYKGFDGMIDELAAWLVDRAEGEPLPALPAWITELSRVFPALASVRKIAEHIAEGRLTAAVPVLEVRRRAVEALRELATTLAARRPLVLAIDDLHWADADSAALLAKLLEPPMPRGLLVAASFRAEEAASNAVLAPYLAMVDELAADGARGDVRSFTIPVGPLSASESERLASATLASLDVHTDGLARAVAEEAAGNPFFVEELAHHAARGRDLEAPTLDRVLVARLQSLTAAERALVEVLAIADHPIPIAVAFGVAELGGNGLRALWSLRNGHFVRSSGSRADDGVELHHDRMRAAVVSAMPRNRQDAIHLALGCAFRDAIDSAKASPSFIFDAARHLASVPSLLHGEERRAAARLQLAAGRRARRGAAFPLAFACLRAGTELLDEAAWDDDYELALALHGGAAEAAYLSAEWSQLDGHVAAVKARGRTIIDQLLAWEVEIDACIARQAYDDAVDAGLGALRLLDFELPAHPTEAQVGDELRSAMTALAGIAATGLASRPLVDDPTVSAAMRIQARISSAAYFARPMLFPVIACRLVATSATRGLSPATPYALSVYGIVLDTLGMFREAHAWGQVALQLIERFDDRSLEARTRHVVHDLVCVWVVPLRSTLDDLRRVVTIGRETGDLEYAAYAAHAYVHNAFYGARELEGLLGEALELGTFMRGHRQVNALHVHEPFEQVLRCFTGRTADPASLDGDGFREDAALATAQSSGSRSAQCIVPTLMGLVRYHFGDATEASACFERARPFLDGVVSTWHVPMFHQYAALAIHALPSERRRALLGAAHESLTALTKLAEQGPENFAHRVRLVAAEHARAEGDVDAALAHCAAAIAGAEKSGFTNDVALGHELAARSHVQRGDANAAARHARAAGAAYQRWGARAKTT